MHRNQTERLHSDNENLCKFMVPPFFGTRTMGLHHSPLDAQGQHPVNFLSWGHQEALRDSVAHSSHSSTLFEHNVVFNHFCITRSFFKNFRDTEGTD